MKRREEIESRALIEEIERYLAALAVFRAQDCEPTWRAERRPDDAPPTVAVSRRRLRSDVELH
jgi:hypothetical protein